ncbi:MAG TPA: hypothetical protein VFN38_14960, partial [Gemmatimonadaceae bacterium]|nr:hypothetical protein [Gemmatimonadaceae bacterium]
VGYVTIGVTMMHRRLLRGAQRHWYDDTVVPLLAAAAAAGLARVAFPWGATTAVPALLATVLGALLLAYTAATLATPAGRELIATLRVAGGRTA